MVIILRKSFLSQLCENLASLTLFIKNIFYSFIHMCIHCLGHSSSLPPAPSVSLPPPRVVLLDRVMLGCHLFGLLKVSQAYLELVAGGWRPVACRGGDIGQPTCCLYIMAWRSLPQAKGSGCQSFNSPWHFTSTKCDFSVSARSLIQGANTVCICVPVAIVYLSDLV
jgi:hypothetical protein